MNKCLYCYKSLEGDVDFHANCSRAFFGTSAPPVIPYSFDQMSELAKEVVEQRIAVPGVQPKLSMSLVKEAQQQPGYRLTVVGALGGFYIFKPPSNDYPEMPENEHLTMRMAEAYGIRVVSSSLIKLKSGELAYISKRIDRTENGDKIHMLDMFQITEAYDKYKSSMEKVGKALHEYSSNTLLDKLFFFELTLFSFLMGNNDMHLKNFSMIEGASGWILAPAYDLLNVSIILHQDDEELALTLEGKKKKLQLTQFQRFGKNLKLTDKQIDGVIKRMKLFKTKAFNMVDSSFLSNEMMDKYKDLISGRFERLGV